MPKHVAKNVVPYGISSASKFSKHYLLPVSKSGPYADHKLSVVYTNHEDEVDAFLARHSTEDYGFDVEHRPTYKPGSKANLSLIQLAPLMTTSKPEVLVFSVYHNKGRIATSIRTLLTSSHIKKYGVGVKGDLQLLAFLAPPTESYVELAPLAHAKKLTDRVQVSLKGLTASIICPSIEYKTKRLTMSNWENILSEEQVRYAAMDAWCGIELLRLIRATM